MKTLTIFTPTYNRAYILPKLYESLCRQTNMDFVWLIVDDGSTDDTEALVRGWIDEGVVEISYSKQPNGGKMRAHNRGVELADTELFVCVDSDDYMTDTAVEEIVALWSNNYSGESNIIGILANRYMTTKDDPTFREVVKLPEHIESCYYRELEFKYGHYGDTSKVFRTEIIKKFPFPEIEGEKFITEAYIYDKIEHAGYKTLLCHKPFVVCEYLPDGYTANVISTYQQAPLGFALYYNQLMEFWPKDFSFKKRMRNLTFYIAMSQMAGLNLRTIWKNCSNKSISFLFALMIAPLYKRKFRRRK